MKTKLHLLFIATLLSLGLGAQNAATIDNQPTEVVANSTYDFIITYTKDPAITEARIQVKFNTPAWGPAGVTYGNTTVTADSGTISLSVPVPGDVADDYILELQLMEMSWAGLTQDYYYGTDVVTTLGTSDLETNLSNLSVYPNPFSDSFSYQFESNTSQSVDVELFTITGQKIKDIKNATISNNRGTVNTENLSKGMYLVRISSGDIQETKRLIKN
ncbi:T9SS type A sorting domain-containing protein [Algibacter sp. AS12]|uniref:T9SS type A sorting domain-containing protein n=1 Tax=Algibacter sp. AS12 TaxID=3135773 RepID=UPI00398B77A5